jgi:hypothetical protein
VSHTGVAPVQVDVFVAEHCPHAPEAWQAGVPAGHSPSPAQPRHECVAMLHTGVAPLQSALTSQPTQAPVAALQTEFGPEHFVAFVAEQTPHAPVG